MEQTIVQCNHRNDNEYDIHDDNINDNATVNIFSIDDNIFMIIEVFFKRC